MKPALSASLRLLALLGLSAGLASASVVSWNYDNNGTVTGTNVAGVVPVANWNNSWPANPTVNLVDDTGAATTVDLAYESFNSWSITGSHPGVDGDGTYNRELLNGYLNSGPAAWGPSITHSRVAISQIDYALYDIIVYFSADVAGREGSVTDGATIYYFNTVGSASVSGSSAVFAGTADTAGLYTTSANYAVFSGLSGASQTITVQMRDNDEWGGIAGFQVVAIPEPASAASLGGMVVLLAAFTRRRRQA
jgi:hypothetical protein